MWYSFVCMCVSIYICIYKYMCVCACVCAWCRSHVWMLLDSLLSSYTYCSELGKEKDATHVILWYSSCDCRRLWILLFLRRVATDLCVCMRVLVCVCVCVCLRVCLLSWWQIHSDGILSLRTTQAVHAHGIPPLQIYKRQLVHLASY